MYLLNVVVSLLECSVEQLVQHILNNHWHCSPGSEINVAFIHFRVRHVACLQEVKHSSKVATGEIQQSILSGLRGIHLFNLYIKMG